ncbi:MAG: hypothetical protein ACRDVP_02955 [Acidimicrobiales bacterium]
MNEIVHSRNAMLLALLGAPVAALGEIMGVIAFAVSDTNNSGVACDVGDAYG